ncbi:MAG: hypothetical protein K9K38_04400 [Rhodoferax sp.]|nr:hypothetical protein [Rhodoferax sp.]
MRPILPERIKAVAQLLGASPAPLSLAQIATHFGNGASLKKSLPPLLQTLEALGRVQRVYTATTELWRA